MREQTEQPRTAWMLFGAGRNSVHHSPGGNIAGDDGAGTDNGILPDPDTRQHSGACADKRAILDMAFTGQNGPRANMRPIANSAVVIDLRPGVDNDLPTKHDARRDFRTEQDLTAPTHFAITREQSRRMEQRDFQKAMLIELSRAC